MFKSIFDQDENQSQNLPLPHLQLNIKAREQALKNLQDKVHYEQNLLNDKNPSYVSVLMNEYKSKLSTVRRQKMQEELKVKSSNFQSIFKNDPIKEEIREERENERRREEYFRNYVLKPKEQESVKKMLRTHTRTHQETGSYSPGKQYKVLISGINMSRPTEEEDKLKEYEVLRMNQLQKQYDMYAAMMGDLFEKNEELIERTSNKFICRNEKILKTLEPIVVGSMSIFAEDIAEALIDDMLEEEVVYMNRMEEFKENANYLISQTEKNHEELVPEVKKKHLPYNVLKALKALDEYADD